MKCHDLVFYGFLRKSRCHRHKVFNLKKMEYAVSLTPKKWSKITFFGFLFDLKFYQETLNSSEHPNLKV